MEKEINLEEFSHSVRYLLTNGILQDTSEIYEYSCGRKAKDVSSISNAISSFSKSMVSIVDLSKISNKFYNYRQKLITRKQLILDDQSFIVAEMAKMKKKEMISYKVGNNEDGIRPSNDTERRMILDGNLSDMQLVVDTLDNHIQFITDSVKNLTDMIYGFTYVIQFEEYRKNY